MSAVQLVLDLGPIIVVEADRRRPTRRHTRPAHPGEVYRRGDWSAAHAAHDAATGIRRLYQLETATNPARAGDACLDAWRPVVTVYPAGTLAVAL